MRRKSIKHLNEQELLKYVSSWERMSLELRLIKTLASKVLCDCEYNDLMPKKTWDKLFKIINVADDVIESCVSRMLKDASEQEAILEPFSTFFPSREDVDVMQEVVSEIRLWTMLNSYEKGKNRLEVYNEER